MSATGKLIALSPFIAVAVFILVSVAQHLPA